MHYKFLCKLTCITLEILYKNIYQGRLFRFARPNIHPPHAPGIFAKKKSQVLSYRLLF